MSAAPDTTAFHAPSNPKSLPVLYEVELAVELEIYDDFVPWLEEHLSGVLDANPEFRKANAYLRNPLDDTHPSPLHYGRKPSASLNGKRETDALHRYFTILYEVDNRDSVEKFVEESAGKLVSAARAKFQGGDTVVVARTRILHPLYVLARPETK
ncbi:hypothetical protein M427DRAFT_71354 [Gonapodya prolifera JEL478]|uniref:Uncharacterized protein n=1 Tax=Gonapodya prolifera (strain JEL478) TaxID=1344416 RepID=A0A139A9C6_GONPJ|nr:hypothetical protein M427DRAFT_71354 [Gonapodya prolifera JEL478]|eukprot:KXS13366.1 hypothetical protein M427DRAFT_71354 [Gonapodya prolifera JEL478]